MQKSRLVRSMFTLATMILGAGVVSGQDYPNKPIRIFTGGAGSGTDVAARLIAQGITAPLGQQLIVENRPSNLAPETVAKASPDGYTLFLSGSNFWVEPLLHKVPFDPIRDFSPVVMATTSPNVLTVHPSLPVKSVKELIALAKAKPGQLNYGSSVTGSSGHLTGELFNAMAGVNIVRIGYKSGGDAVTALISGEVQLGFNPAGGAVISYVKSGRLKTLAVASAQPSVLVPGVPTMADAGLPGCESASIQSVFAPAKTPAPIITRLNQEIVRFLSAPESKERLINASVEAIASTPEQLAATVKLEITKWGKVIKDAGIRVD